VDDVFTALGKVWYRGDEIEFAPGSQAYKDTQDRFGVSWLDKYIDNDELQAQAWGRVVFRRGPWPGEKYAAAAGKYQKRRSLSGSGDVGGPSETELSALDEAARKARRVAPTLPRL